MKRHTCVKEWFNYFEKCIDAEQVIAEMDGTTHGKKSVGMTQEDIWKVEKLSN